MMAADIHNSNRPSNASVSHRRLTAPESVIVLSRLISRPRV
jgi:hypothetical protein